jgi:hypothetical protein
VNACSIPTDAREVYHTFDSEYDDSEGEHRSLGVTCFRFHENSTSGDGYFVVHGGGGIRKGRIAFTLDRVTPEFCRMQGLQPIELTLSDRRGCASGARGGRGACRAGIGTFRGGVGATAEAGSAEPARQRERAHHDRLMH